MPIMSTKNHYNTLTVTENVLKIIENWFEAEKSGNKNARVRAAHELEDYLIETDDGSYTLISNEFNGKAETMHSYHGGVTESIEKFVKPSKLREKLDSGRSLHVLDICSGLGYHSGACIEFLGDKLCDKNLGNEKRGEHSAASDELKIHHPEIRIDMVEISIETIAATLLIPSPLRSHELIKKAVEEKLHREGFIKFKVQDNSGGDVLDEKIPENCGPGQKSDTEHRTEETGNSTCKEGWVKDKWDKISENVDINIYCEDARDLIKKVVKTEGEYGGDYGGNYDAIFLAPFSPSKSPELCTVEFFRALKGILKEDGMVLTYTSAAPVRSAFIEAGFHVGVGPCFGRSGGTIASPSPWNIETPLSMDDERMIALSDVGLPFRDPELKSSGSEILERRAEERRIVRNSSKFASTVRTPIYLGKSIEDIDDPRLKRRILKGIERLGFEDLDCEELRYIVCPQFDDCICGSNCQKTGNSRDRIREMIKRLSELVE